MLNQQRLKENNMRQIFAHLSGGQGVSRVGLSRLTGLSKTTVRALVDEMIVRDYLIEKATSTGKQGGYGETICTNSENDSAIYVNMSRGVGALLFMTGRLIAGSNGLATAMGHFSVDRNGEKCACGGRGRVLYPHRLSAVPLGSRSMPLGRMDTAKDSTLVCGMSS